MVEQSGVAPGQSGRRAASSRDADGLRLLVAPGRRKKFPSAIKHSLPAARCYFHHNIVFFLD